MRYNLSPSELSELWEPVAHVERAGLASNLQDSGRQARSLGFASSGAADSLSYQLAEILVGNTKPRTSLEITLQGPRLRFTRSQVVALCGANFVATLDGQVMPLWRAVSIKAGSTLIIDNCSRGLRGYLSVAGGWQGQTVLGSQSTDVRGGFGGLAGRNLQRGDVLQAKAITPDFPSSSFSAKAIAPALRTSLSQHHVLRLLASPEATPQLSVALTRRSLTVSQQLDRMGVRLQERLVVPAIGQRPSLPNSHGTLQLPPDGQPILLLPDAGTHGGYLSPFVVARVDWPKLGQLRPADRVAMRLVSLAEARAALARQVVALRAVRVGQSK